MLEILTPLNKVERVSRVIDTANFVAEPGIWAKVNADGSLSNVDGTPADINKLVISSSSDNIYESHDVEVGRISAMESIGVRCKVDGDGFAGTINQGNLLMVSSDTGGGTEGKLVDVGETAETGTFEQVARAEEVNATSGYIVFRTISPVPVTLT